MVSAGFEWTTQQADAARQHYQARQHRLRAQHAEVSPLAARTLANKAPLASAARADGDERQRKIAQMLALARARRAESDTRQSRLAPDTGTPGQVTRVRTPASARVNTPS